MRRRHFVRAMAAATAGVMVGGVRAMAQRRRQVSIAGRRVKTIDVHAHVTIPEAAAVLRGTPLERAGGAGGGGGQAGGAGRAGGAAGAVAGQVMGPERLRTMDGYGMDIQALSINPFWYAADR